MDADSDSTFLRHTACPDCGSSDALAEYSDGHTYCFSCGTHKGGSGTQTVPKETPAATAGLIEDIEVDKGIPARGLTPETTRFWGYGYGFWSGQKVHVAPFRDPTTNQMIGQKVRTQHKDFVSLGNTKGLYGRWLWKTGGKKLVITEGEIDTLTVSQLQGHKWPVVSVPNGANGALKAVMRDLEWVESFDEVVIMFDMDDPGRQAAVEVAEVLTPGKAKVARLPLKDPNECLLAGRGQEVIQAIWNATPYRPDGIVSGDTLWSEVVATIPTADAEYPWETLNGVTKGLRRGELVTIGAGSGCGKSTLVDNITWSLSRRREPVGYIGLETNTGKAARSIVGLEVGHRLSLGRGEVTEEALKAAFDATVGNGSTYLYDHFGSMDGDNLLAKIRYMVKGLGVRWVILDHVSIVVSGMGDGDERRMIDNLMTKLRSLTEETQCGLILISHLRRPDKGKDWVQGRIPSESDFRGSASIYQLSDIVLGLSRNGVSDDPEVRNKLALVVIKNRFSGDTGPAGVLAFDRHTGRLSQDNATDFPAYEPGKEY